MPPTVSISRLYCLCGINNTVLSLLDGFTSRIQINGRYYKGFAMPSAYIVSFHYGQVALMARCAAKTQVLQLGSFDNGIKEKRSCLNPQKMVVA
jgi:hypothetical protein